MTSWLSRPDKSHSPYGKKLLDPRWQKKRLLILDRDTWKCQSCGDTEETLHVHHRWYSENSDPWDVPDEALVTLCQPCHEYEATSRRSCEAILLKELCRHYLSDDLDRLALMLFRMPRDACIALASGGSYPPDHQPLEIWLKRDREVFFANNATSQTITRI